MTPQETIYYMQAMDIIEARERLRLMDALCYPRLKDDKARDKKHRTVYKKAYPDNFNKDKVIKTTDLRLF